MTDGLVVPAVLCTTLSALIAVPIAIHVSLQRDVFTAVLFTLPTILMALLTVIIVFTDDPSPAPDTSSRD